MADDERDRPGVVAPAPLVFAAALLIGWLIQKAMPALPLPGALRVILGLPLAGVSLFLGAWAARTMRHAGTNIDPRKPATALVVTGPFRFTRNPVYLSMAVLYVGITVLINTLWPLLLLPVALVAIQLGAIEREERYLERKFGEAYQEYKATVRRWL